jgi:hypothetical protein
LHGAECELQIVIAGLATHLQTDLKNNVIDVLAKTIVEFRGASVAAVVASITAKL